MPRGVSKRIMRLCAENEVAVVTSHRGKPSKIYHLSMYLKMQKHPKKVQPWTYRTDRRRDADPLGAVDMGEIFMPLTREHLYE